jgi:hypothetical protein
VGPHVGSIADTIPCIPGFWNNTPLFLEGTDESASKEQDEGFILGDKLHVMGLNMNDMTWPRSSKDTQLVLSRW